MSGNPAATPPLVVLVEPQMGENIGMCARAMLNCGLDHLRLVRPRDGWPNPAAAATAADADTVLERAEVFPTLAAAIADCHHVVVTSARDRALPVPVLGSSAAVAKTRAWSGEGALVAVVFGPEASGLDTDAISRADLLLRFETNPDFSSLNLAQSVLLFAWEWRSAGAGEEPEKAGMASRRGDVSLFLDRLEAELEERGFFLTPDLKPTTLGSLRSLFSRAAPTERELALLQGMLTALTREKREGKQT